MPPADPRRALARALYLAQPARGIMRTPEMFYAAWAWLLDERNAAYVADSEIGKIAARVDRVLRWIEAAGLEVVAKK